MADALVAALLAGQRRRRDPYETQRRYGLGIMQQGMNTAPVQSWGEGLARALQGAVGGYFAGEADRSADERDKRTVSAMADLLSSPDQAAFSEKVAALKEGGMDTDTLAPVLGQMLANKQSQFRAGEAAKTFGRSFAPPGMGGPQGNPLEITNTPQPGQVSTSPIPPPSAAGGPNQFNIGNVRPVGGGPNSGFQQPATWEEGVNLAISNARAYPAKFNSGQPMTLVQIGERWAPRGDGANDPVQWAKNVASIGGLPVDQPINLDDPAVAAAFARGVHGAEWGPKALRPPDAYMVGPRVAQGSDMPRADASGTPLPPQTPSAASGPPELPRPQPTPDQIQRYQGLISSGQMTVQQATQALNQEITQEWQTRRQIALGTWKDQQTSKRQNEKAAIELGQKAPMELLKARADDYEKNIRPKAEGAVTEINAIHGVRQLLDAGAFTGLGAGAKSFGSRLAQTFGLDWGADVQANTAALQSAIAQRVLPLVKNLGAGSAISNADREYAEKAAGGQIEVGEKAMRRILDIGERAARATIKSHDQAAARIKNAPGVGQLGNDFFALPEASNYDEWSKANPLPTPEVTVQATPPSAAAAPAPPAATAAPVDPGSAAVGRQVLEQSDPRFAAPPQGQPAPQQGATPAPQAIPDGAIAVNPQTGQRIVRRNGQWVPAQ